MATFFNAKQLAQAMRDRANALPVTQDIATRIIGRKAVEISLKHMNRLIYAIPIPLRKNGKPQWEWTYRLRDSERVEYVKGTEGLVAVLRNNMRYAEFRHEMGKTGRRSTKRPAHWRDEAREEFRSMALSERRTALQAALGRVATKQF
jgi:hypothetical protein